jgi:hypothetical protein
MNKKKENKTKTTLLLLFNNNSETAIFLKLFLLDLKNFVDFD